MEILLVYEVFAFQATISFLVKVQHSVAMYASLYVGFSQNQPADKSRQTLEVNEFIFLMCLNQQRSSDITSINTFSITCHLTVF
jgi:hypothetical protein